MKRRKEKRHVCSLPVRFLVNGEQIQGQLRNVSHSGAFIETQSPPNALEMFRLEVEALSQSIKLLGVAAHAQELTQDGPRNGVGLQLFGNSPDIKDVWSEIVEAAAQGRLPGGKPLLQIIRPPIADDDGSPSTSLDVRPLSKEGFEKVLSMVDSRNALVVEARHFLAAGTPVSVTLFEPGTAVQRNARGVVRRALAGHHSSVIVDFSPDQASQLLLAPKPRTEEPCADDFDLDIVVEEIPPRFISVDTFETTSLIDISDLLSFA